MQWFKSQKANKPGRVLPPPSTSKSSGRHATNLSQPSNDEKLENLKVAIAGGSAEDFVSSFLMFMILDPLAESFFYSK